MKIRQAKVKDIEQIVGLWKESGLYFEPFDKEERLVKKLEKGQEFFLVAEEQNKVIGTVIGSYGWRVSIDHLVVNTEYTKQGIGEKLFEEIKNKLRKKGASVALVDSALPKQFWENLECKYRGTFNNYTVEL